jgi:hypothetical protein
MQTVAQAIWLDSFGVQCTHTVLYKVPGHTTQFTFWDSRWKFPSGSWGQILSPWLEDIQYVVDYGIGLSGHTGPPAYVAYRAATTTLCHSRLLTPVSDHEFGLWYPPPLQLDWKVFFCSAICCIGVKAWNWTLRKRNYWDLWSTLRPFINLNLAYNFSLFQSKLPLYFMELSKQKISNK